MQYVSPARVEKARQLLEERQRRNQTPTLIDCLQFSDKLQIIARDERLATRSASYPAAGPILRGKCSRRCATTWPTPQDIIASDWDTIFAMADNLDRLLTLVSIG